MSERKNKSPRFPFFVDISGWKILMVGGGTIAQRRVKVLSDFGPEITVISPAGTGSLEELAEKDRIRWFRREYTESDLTAEPWNLVLTATDNETLNSQIVFACRERKIPVNNSSDQSQCDFFFPAIIEGQGMVIGLVSDGSDHGSVRQVAAKIRSEYGDKENE